MACADAYWKDSRESDRCGRSRCRIDNATALQIAPETRRRKAPTHFTAPSGSVVSIDYEAPEGPKLSIRVQELFGLNKHPSIAGGRIPLVVELLSPAHRPVQLTRDLLGSLRGSYADVRSDMRGVIRAIRGRMIRRRRLRHVGPSRAARNGITGR